MSVTAKRFGVVGQDMSVPVSPFSMGLDSSILNDPMNALPAETPSLDDLIQSGIQDGLAEPEVKTSLLDDVTRATKDIRGGLSDLKSLPDEKLDEFMGILSDGDKATATALKRVLQKCSGRGMGMGFPGRPWSPSIDCGNGGVSMGQRGYSSSGCSSSSYGDLLNKITDGGYGGTFSDFNKLLRKLMSLSGLGYNLGMCGVFGAVGSKMPGMVQERGMAGLMGMLSSSGNTRGIFDLAKNASGLNPLQYLPDGLTGIFDNFELPWGTRESNLGGVADQMNGSMELFDSGWSSSLYDGSPSMAMPSIFNTDLGSAYNAKLCTRDFDPTALEVPEMSDDDFLMGSYVMMGEDDYFGGSKGGSSSFSFF